MRRAQLCHFAWMIETLKQQNFAKDEASADPINTVAIDLLTPYFGGARTEHLAVAGFDEAGRLVAFTEVAGSTTRVDGIVSVVRSVIGHIAVVAIILAHNHLDCDPEPSVADIQATRQIERLTRLGNVRLLDHLIFSRAGIVSLRARGML